MTDEEDYWRQHDDGEFIGQRGGRGGGGGGGGGGGRGGGGGGSRGGGGGGHGGGGGGRGPLVRPGSPRLGGGGGVGGGGIGGPRRGLGPMRGGRTPALLGRGRGIAPGFTFYSRRRNRYHQSLGWYRRRYRSYYRPRLWLNTLLYELYDIPILSAIWLARTLYAENIMDMETRYSLAQYFMENDAYLNEEDRSWLYDEFSPQEHLY